MIYIISRNRKSPSCYLLAKQLPGRVMDKMQPSAGWAYDGLVTVLLVLWSVGQEMLHIEARDGAFKKNRSSHG